MSVPIAQILGAEYGLPVHAEYVHPVLAGEKSGPGRRPEVDFVVGDDSGSIKCVVESKWVGADGLTASKIIWDLLRLELIANDRGAEAYFILAGRRRHLEAFFASDAFRGAEVDGTYRRLLKTDHRRNARLRVDNPPADRMEAFKRVLLPYLNVDFPARVSTSRCYFYPTDVPKSQYQVYAWRVFAPAGTPRFRPGTHKLYVSGQPKAKA